MNLCKISTVMSTLFYVNLKGWTTEKERRTDFLRCCERKLLENKSQKNKLKIKQKYFSCLPVIKIENFSNIHLMIKMGALCMDLFLSWLLFIDLESIISNTSRRI